MAGEGMVFCDGCGTMLTPEDEPIVWIRFEPTGVRINLHQFCARQLEQAVHWRLAENDAGNTPDPEEPRTFLAVRQSSEEGGGDGG